MSLKLRIRYIWNHVLFQLSFVLFAFYLTIGSLFLFSNTWIDFIPVGREIIGSTLVLFGCLRFYIAYRRYKTKHDKIQQLKKEKKVLEEKLLEESIHEKVQ